MKEGGDLPTGLFTYKTKFEQPEYVWTIQDLKRRGTRTLLVGPGGVGKTALLLNAGRALIWGEPFLGSFETMKARGRLMYFNYEMVDHQFMDWAEKIGLHPNKDFVGWNLLGRRMPFWEPECQGALIAKFQKLKVTTWIIDSAIRAMKGCGSHGGNPSEVTDVTQFMEAIDVIKVEAGIEDIIISHHTPHDKDRPIGSVRWEHAVDGVWSYTKNEHGDRFFSVGGEFKFRSNPGELLPSGGQVTFDENTFLVSLPHMSITRNARVIQRAEATAKSNADLLSEFLVTHDLINVTNFRASSPVQGKNHDTHDAAVEEGAKNGSILIFRGPGNVKRFRSSANAHLPIPQRAVLVAGHIPTRDQENKLGTYKRKKRRKADK